MYFPKQKFYKELDEGELYPNPKFLDEYREDIEKRAKLLASEKAEMKEVAGQLAELSAAAKVDKYHRRFGHVEKVSKSALKRRREELAKDIPAQEASIAKATKMIVENLDKVSIRTNGDGYRVIDCLRVLDGQAKSEADRGALLSRVLTSQIFDGRFYFKLDEFLMENTQFLSGVLMRKEKEASQPFATNVLCSVSELFLASKDFGEKGGFVYNLIKGDAGYRERFFELEYGNMPNILVELNKEDKKFFKGEIRKYQVHSGRKNRAGDQIVKDTGSVIEGLGNFVNGTVKVVTAPVVFLGKGIKKLNTSASRQAVYKKNREIFADATKKAMNAYKFGMKGVKGVVAHTIMQEGKYYLRVEISRQRKGKQDIVIYDYPIPEGEGRTIEQLLGERRFFNFTKKPKFAEDDKIIRYIAHAVAKSKPQGMNVISAEVVSDEERAR